MLKRNALALLITLCLLPVFCGLARAADSSGKEDYTISTDDVLEIKVYGEDDLSVTSRVSPDGTINYPFLGNIRASGLTARELESNITDLLGEDYLVNPQVTVFIREYAKISILGAVVTPGSYQMKENLTLTQVVALAGGFTETADTSQVKIIRITKNRGKETIEVNVDQILDKAAADIDIKSNDTIMVEEYGRFSVMGQVNKPGVYALKRGLTAVEAIGLAGGFTPTAAQNGTRIVRMENGVKKVVSVPVADIMRGGDVSRDSQLRAGDTIVVPESFF